MKAKGEEECRERGFLCCVLFPFTVLVTIEMTLQGKGKPFPSPGAEGMPGISQPPLYFGARLDLSCAQGEWEAQR